MRLALFGLLIIGACSGQTSEEQRDNRLVAAADETSRRVAEPVYGPARDMQGLYTSAFEVSAFTHCKTEKLDACGVESEPHDCWFEGSEKFAQQFDSAIPASERVDGGVYYIRFRGQQADNGAFGHMSAYLCQVKGLTLVSAKTGLP